MTGVDCVSGLSCEIHCAVHSIALHSLFGLRPPSAAGRRLANSVAQLSRQRTPRSTAPSTRPQRTTAGAGCPVFTQWQTASYTKINVMDSEMQHHERAACTLKALQPRRLW